MLNLSLFTVSFAGLWGQHRLSLEDSIRKTSDLGYQGVEIMGKRPHLSPLDYSVEDCDVLRDQLDSQGLKVSAVAAYTNFTGGMDSPEVPFPDLQIAYIEALAERTARLGGDLIRIFTSYERADIPFASQWQATVGAIRQCADRAADHGVTIGIQNHHDIGVATKALQELLSDVDRPNVTPMYDLWSVYLMGEDVVAGTRAMGPRMRFTTVADYVTIPRAHYKGELVNYTPVNPPYVQAVPMGQGELPYDLFFKTLLDTGFDGWISYEMCCPVRGGGAIENIEQYAHRFIQYMRALEADR